MKFLAAAAAVLFFASTMSPEARAGMYDTDALVSGLLYGVRLDGKRPCEYLQVILKYSPTEFRPYQKALTQVFLLGSDKKTILQRLPPDFDGSTAEEGDFNFDGYRDFRSLRWQESGSGGRVFAHFLFDPQKRRYVACPQLDNLSSPYPDYQRKIIRSHARSGGMYSVSQELRWKKGNLVVLSEVWRDRDEKGWFTEYSTFENGRKKKARRIYLKNN